MNMFHFYWPFISENVPRREVSRVRRRRAGVAQRHCGNFIVVVASLPANESSKYLHFNSLATYK